jgi:hypothetical protein
MRRIDLRLTGGDQRGTAPAFSLCRLKPMWPTRAAGSAGQMREFDAVKGIILATVLGALIWLLLTIGVFG